MKSFGRLAVIAGALLGLMHAGVGCVGGGAGASQRLGIGAGVGKPAAVTGTYEVYVANESSDIVSRLRYVPGGDLEVIGRVPVGLMPADIDGPHGLTISPDGRHWFVSLAHGTPYGTVWKYTTEGDTLVGRVQLGLFPATMGISPDGQFLYVVNFNLHGDPVPSSVSVVYTPTMTEVARPTTCVMPHGSRLNASGTRHYSACMHSEQLVEIDTRTLRVSNRFSLTPGHEAKLPTEDSGEHVHHASSHGAAGEARTCSPTWAQPARGERADRYVYVACNRNDEVVEVDVDRWEITRRFETGRGPYNLEVSPDGRLLVVTLKGAQGVMLIDLDRGREAATLRTSQPVTHGVVITPDGRYAFVTNEAIGSTRGTVDVIDLAARERVATADVEHQPGGIDMVRAPGMAPAN